MAFVPKDNNGSLFVNDRKTQDNHPDRSGTIMVEGKTYWINGWLRKTDAGVPWLSLSVKPKEGAQAPARRPPPARNDYAERGDPPQRQASRPDARQPDYDDSIPF